MKIQNILGALLLVVASQAAYGVEVRIFNNSNKPIEITLVYKNDKLYTNRIEPTFSSEISKKTPKLFTVVTKANPIKEILYRYIGDKELWSFPINCTKSTDRQVIFISAPKYIDYWNYSITENQWIETGKESITAKHVHDDV